MLTLRTPCLVLDPTVFPYILILKVLWFYIEVPHLFWVNFCMLQNLGQGLCFCFCCVFLFVFCCVLFCLSLDTKWLQNHLMKKFFFLHWIVFAAFLKIPGYACVGLFLNSLFCSMNLCVLSFTNNTQFNHCSYIISPEIGQNYFSYFIHF